jgi:hypothetical protein
MGNTKVLRVQGIVPVVIILLAALMRLVPHPANVSPIAAMALFGGVYLDKKFAVLLPITAMVISDFFLGFHQSMPFVYGSFFLISTIGMWIRNHKTPLTVVGGSLFSSFLFFLITNFGFWLTDSLYPKTFAGQMTSYFMAMPFFRNTLIGDLLYTGLLFGGYEFVRSLFARKAVSKS